MRVCVQSVFSDDKKGENLSGLLKLVTSENS